ncbi:MAG: hypothetical protein E6719_04120, partial [Dermabacter sp.]|nr:hypothetical protein [Dermabacter sp.]
MNFAWLDPLLSFIGALVGGGVTVLVSQRTLGFEKKKYFHERREQMRALIDEVLSVLRSGYENTPSEWVEHSLTIERDFTHLATLLPSGRERRRAKKVSRILAAYRHKFWQYLNLQRRIDNNQNVSDEHFQTTLADIDSSLSELNKEILKLRQLMAERD